MEITKIVFTGDFFRPSKAGVPSQEGNIKWLYHFFKPIIKILLPEIKVFRFAWEKNNLFSPKDFYEELRLELNLESWALTHEYCGESKELDRLISEYFHSSFVIGFELPPVLCERLQKANIPYLDLVISPVRFLDDLFFELNSNISTLQKLFAANEISRYEITCCAARITAQFSREESLFVSPTALIVGQTVGDRSLICNGKFLTLMDEIDSLKSFADKFEKVLYKPHPYDDGSFVSKEILHELRFETINTNIYRLLSQENLIASAGVSSSCLFESEYFDVVPTFFGKKRQQGIVVKNIHEITFWQAVLNCLGLDTTAISNLSQPLVPNTFRNSLNEFWGYTDVGLSNAFHAAKQVQANKLSPPSIIARIAQRFADL